MAGTPVWVPTPGKQSDAANCEADVLFYGGSAGGGKTDLLCGLAATKYHRTAIFRKDSTQLVGIADRLEEIFGHRKGFNSNNGIWRLPDRQIELCGVSRPGAEKSYQGRAHALKGFDEITHFKESVFRFLCGWLRGETAGVKKRIICTGNPPTDIEGEWVIKYFAPWLDEEYEHERALPGELRWFTMLDGKETEVENGESFIWKGETLEPKSRTFIASNVRDNPFMMAEGYEATLQALPEPLRSQMLKGDFQAGKEDNVWQIIPRDWVKAAQARWKEDGYRDKKMTAMGVDVARGGRDNTVLAPRYEYWFAPLIKIPGVETPNGPAVAGRVISELRDGATVQIDIIGVGGSPYDFLKSNKIATFGVNSSAGSRAKDRSGKLGFINLRAELWWKMREALDPVSGENLALPPGRSLMVDLCTPRWHITARGVQVESKEEIIDRIGRSPDEGEAIIYARPTYHVREIARNSSYNDGESNSNGWMKS